MCIRQPAFIIEPVEPVEFIIGTVEFIIVESIISTVESIISTDYIGDTVTSHHSEQLKNNEIKIQYAKGVHELRPLMRVRVSGKPAPDI